ncbi:hypothetical protein D031_1589B, partial [Vibrio parahaemolyticus VP-48]
RDQLVFCDHVASWAQTVSVEVTCCVAAIGKYDPCWAIPRLHVFGVEIVEGS